MATKPKLGDLVEVTWLDTTAFTNTTIAKVKLSRGVNIGELVQIDKRSIILQTGIYPDDAPPDQLGDFTIIPRSWEDKIKILKRRKR